MKTTLAFGVGIGIANALLTLVLFFCGLHSDPAKLGTVGIVGGLVALAIYIAGLILGVRARREEVPADRPFGYSQAFGTALMISLFALIVGVAFQFLYETVINPNFLAVSAQAQRAAWEAKGMSDDQIEKAENFMKPFNSPAVRAIFIFVVLGAADTVISLIVAGVMKRKNSDEAISL
jgi:hypothetical protein